VGEDAREQGAGIRDRWIRPCGHQSRLDVIGHYEGEQLIYVARVRNGFTPASRSEVLKQLPRGQEIPRCPFVNLPQRDKGRWGEV